MEKNPKKNDDLDNWDNVSVFTQGQMSGIMAADSIVSHLIEDQNLKDKIHGVLVDVSKMVRLNSIQCHEKE